MARAAHAGAAGRRRRLVRPVAGLTALLLCASGFGLTSPAAAAAFDVRVDLPTATSSPTIIAASGPGILLDAGQNAPNYLATADNGATFTSVSNPGLTKGELGGARNGKLATYVPADGDDADHTSVYVYDFATGTTADPIEVPAEDVVAVDPSTAIYSDGTGYLAEDLASEVAQSLFYEPASEADSIDVSLGGGSQALMTHLTFDSSGRASDGYVDLVPLDGTAAPAGQDRKVIPGLAAATIRDDQVVYVKETSKTLSLCFRSAATWSVESCRSTSISGLSDQRDASVEIFAGAGWVQWAILAPAGDAIYLVPGTTTPGTLVPVDAVGNTTLAWLGDPERPLAALPDEDPGYIGQVNADGSFSSLFGFPDTPVAVTALELTPDRVTGLDNRPTVLAEDYQAWQRDVSDATIGDETTPFPRGLDVGTTGGRTLLDDGTKLRLYDRGQPVRTLSRSKYGSLPGLVSGPYFPAYSLSYTQALRVDGTLMKTGSIRGMFGSLVLVRTNAKLGRYDVVDLVDKSTIRVNVPLRYRLQGFSLAGLVGDWVYGYSFNVDMVPYTLAINFRTNTTYERYGLPVDYGDGFVAVKYADTAPDGSDVTGLEVWNPVTGEAETIPDTDWDQVVTDGTHRLAYTTASELVLRDLRVVPVVAPRLLGVLAPASLNLITSTRSWPLEVDTTKALDEGTLTITDADGVVVRTLATPAGADGSLRGLAWDGRDEGGADVPVGDYNWNLVAPAADGSGNVVGVDGKADVGETPETEGVAGSLHVARTYLGTLSGPTPTISGTTKVDRTLTAKPGTWTPSTADLTYQWYRTTTKGTTAIVGAQAATHKVTPEDVGARLSVKVIGTLEGWKSTTKSSAMTATVTKAAFTQAPTPTIDDPTPAVGNTLTAFPGTWEPIPVDLTYRWYRVSSTGKVSSSLGTGPTYVVKAADAGSRLKVSVTGTKSGYTTATKTSKVTSAVAKG